MTDHDEARRTAYALDQLDAAERTDVQRRLTAASQQSDTARVGRLSELLRESADADESCRPSSSLREAVESRLAVKNRRPLRSRRVRVAAWAAVAVAACVALAIVVPLVDQASRRADGDRAQIAIEVDSLVTPMKAYNAYDSRGALVVVDNSRSMSLWDTADVKNLAAASVNTRFFNSQVRLAGGNGDKGGGPAASDLPRQIVHRGGLELRVEDFDALVGQIDELIEQHSAEIADSNITGSPGSPRTGVWTFRVPTDALAAFRAGLRELGELQNETTSSDDVSSTYYDVEARLETKRLTLDRLREHLKSAEKTEDTLMVEQQLDRVTGDVESLQRQMNYLKNQVALATVQLTVSEVSSYTPEETPSLGTRVGRSYSNSLDALRSTGEALLMTVVAVGPWLIPLSAVLLAVYLVIRKKRRAVKQD